MDAGRLPGHLVRSAFDCIYHKGARSWQDPLRSLPANGPTCPSTPGPEGREFGYDGLELACWGDHFEVDKALEDDSYIKGRRDILNKYGLKCWAISCHLVGQAVSDDPIDERHRGILPPRIWGDGEPEGVRQRAAEEIKNTARAASQVRRQGGARLYRLPHLEVYLLLPAHVR